jgi:hypothetical protein
LFPALYFNEPEMSLCSARRPAQTARCRRAILYQKYRFERELNMKAGIRVVGRGLFLLFSILAVSSFTPALHAQLQFSKNYFLTGGDYVVGGWQKQTSNGVTTTGIINVPDDKQPFQPGVATQVPAGANIVAAFLYWETVESSKSSFAGQVGVFNGFPITGTILGNPNAPSSWSSGGCAGNNAGSKTMRAYRADVRQYLNLTSTVMPNGTAVPAGNGSYTVTLADSGGSPTPITLGATLVIIYSVPSVSLSTPLNGIVIYDGAFNPNNSGSTLSQQISWFYQASKSTPPIAKLTHIVGNGQQNKLEAVSLSGVNLPSLYPTPLSPTWPPFPGLYNNSWDNPTWLVNQYGSAVNANDNFETAIVTPNQSNAGCVSWGAIVFSTTVEDNDKDGLVDAWEDGQGYTDPVSGWVPLTGADKTVKDIFVEVDYLTALGPNNTGHSHLPKQEALDKVGQAFANAPVDCDANGCKGVHIHFDVGNVYQKPMAGGPSVACATGMCDPYIVPYNPGFAPGGNEIPESVTLCNDGAQLCAYPGIPTIGWKAGLLFVRNNATVPGSNPAIPLGNFQSGRRNSYHYLLSGHAMGIPRSFWSAYGNSTPAAPVSKLVSIDLPMGSNTATVTLKSPPNLLKPGDPVLSTDPAFGDPSLDRVTISGALIQTALNGTYKFASSSSTGPDANNLYTTTFTITTSGVATGTYNFANEPHLGIAFGGPTATSGHSDVPGGDSAVTFGLWPGDNPTDPITGVLLCNVDPSQGPPYCNDQVGTVQSQAGTIMHELGHTADLTHGGLYFDSSSPTPYIPVNLGQNCKPNFLSIMNYSFQVRGFPGNVDPTFPDTFKIDYSGQLLANLNEDALNESAGIGATARYFTRWYSYPNASTGDPATRHCGGSPLKLGEIALAKVDNSSFPVPPNPAGPIDWNNSASIDPGIINPLDINFNGATDTSNNHMNPSPLVGFLDWNRQTVNGTIFGLGMDLRQIGVRRAAAGESGGIDGIAGGIDGIAGGIDGIAGGIDGIAGGIDGIAGGIDGIAGGIDGIAGGIDGIAGGVDVDFPTANSTVDAPTNLTATWIKAPLKLIRLNWNAPIFGQVRFYYVYRLLGGPVPNPLATATLVTPNGIPGTPPKTTFDDTTVAVNTTYTYYVVAQILQDNRKSGVSNSATQTTK